MLKVRNAKRLRILGFPIALLIFISFNSERSIAESKFIRIITDADGIVNFLDVNSIKKKGQERIYTTVRASAIPAKDDYSMALRRPYSGQRCACPYDYSTCVCYEVQ